MKSAPHAAPRFNFPDKAAAHSAQVPEKPGQSAAAACPDDFCPYCQRTLPGSGTNAGGLLQLGVKQLVGAVYMIAAGIVRCLRFAVAGVLCLMGLIGSCCFGLALRIATIASCCFDGSTQVERAILSRLLRRSAVAWAICRHASVAGMRLRPDHLARIFISGVNNGTGSEPN